MQPTVAGDILVGCERANSSPPPPLSARSQSRNPQTINRSKHYDALCWKILIFGNVMNGINYSTAESWRNSLELIDNHTVVEVLFLMMNMEHAGSKVLFIRPHASVMAEGNYNPERPRASLCKDNTKTVQPAHDEPLTPAIITRISLIFRSIWK